MTEKFPHQWRAEGEIPLSMEQYRLVLTEQDKQRPEWLFWLAMVPVFALPALFLVFFVLALLGLA